MKQLFAMAIFQVATVASAAVPGPTAEKLGKFSDENRLLCATVNETQAQLLSRTGDKARAVDFSMRAKQFLDPDAKLSDSLQDEVISFAKESADLAEKDDASRGELRSIIKQCDDAAEITPLPAAR